jgi:hypothetical protein
MKVERSRQTREPGACSGSMEVQCQTGADFCGAMSSDLCVNNGLEGSG